MLGERRVRELILEPATWRGVEVLNSSRSLAASDEFIDMTREVTVRRETRETKFARVAIDPPGDDVEDLSIT